MADTNAREMSSFAEESAKATRNVSHLEAALQRLEKQGKKTTPAYEAMAKEWEEAKKVGDAFAIMQKNISSAFPRFSKNMKYYSSILSDTTKEYKKQMETLVDMANMSEDQYKKMVDSVEEYKQAVEKITGEPVEINVRAKKELRKEALMGAAEKMGGGMMGVGKGLAGVTGLSSKTLTTAVGAFKGTWESGKELTSSFKGLTGMMSAAGKGAGLFKGALNMLGMALKANPIMLIIGAIQMVASVVNDLDQMIKGLNKSYREMAGSPVLLKDIRGSMKAFNDAIFNLDRNMRLGLKASDINEFFKTMSTAGLSTEGVNKRIGDFNQAIEQGFKLSREFGVSFSEMGQMMADQMLNLRTSLQDVSDGFKSMSYDAAVAGVQSQKFYQVVESASMSLSFYGNFLKSTSARLRDFVQTGTMGFKDASQTVQDLMNTYKGMGMDQRRAIVNIIGEDEMKKMFAERDTQMSKDIEKLEGEAARYEKTDPKAYAAAKMRLEAMRGDQRNLREATRTGDVTALGSMLEVLSDKVLDAAAKVLERTGVNFFKDKAAAFVVLQQQFGWGIDMVNKAFKKSNVTMDIMREHVDEFKKAMGEAGSKATFKELSDKVRGFITDPTVSPYSSFEAMSKDVKEKLEARFGKGSKIATDMMSMLSTSESAFADFLDSTTERSNKSMEQIATGAGITTQAREKAGMTEDQLDQMIKQTTPLADYLDIGKENIKYSLASSNIQNTIAIGVTETARGVGNLLKFFTGQYGRSKGGKGREEEFTKKDEGKVEDVYKRLKMIDVLLTKVRKLPELTPGRKEEIDVLTKAQEDLTKEGQELENTWADIPVVLDKSRQAAYTAAEDWTKSLSDAEQAMKDSSDAYAELKKREADRTLTDEQRATLLRKEKEASDKYYAAEAERYKLTMQYADAVKAASKGGKAGDYQAVNLAQNIASTEAVAPPKMDFSALTGGWVRVAPKDVVINGDSLAKGMGMGRGQLMNAGPGIMKGAGGVGGGGFTMGNVELNFNAPLNGNPEEYRKMFVEAVNDVVSKRLYEQKARV